MTVDCQRWIELSDRQAAGQTLPAEALDFVRVHAASCPECAREDAVWQGLRAPPPSVDVPLDAEVEAMLAGAASAGSRERRARQQRWATAGATALAIAAGLALWLGRGPAEPRSGEQARTPANDAAPSPRAPVPAQGTSVSSTADAPAALAAACSEAVSGVWVCTAPGSQIDRRELDSSERLIGLARGRLIVALKPQPAGTSFSVVTAAGRVTAVGTVFAVEAKEDGTTIARVLEGKVAVRVAGAADVRPLKAGESLHLGDERPAPLSAEDRDRDLVLLPLEHRAQVTQSQENLPPSASPGTAAPTPESLLAQARSLRARGEFRRAADIYRNLHESSPASASGGAALVSLGELRLSSLGDPAGALSAFDSYLARGGPLSQEAAYGRVRALRALGRAGDERRAIERFIAQFPGAPQSRILRQRLHALEP